MRLEDLNAAQQAVVQHPHPAALVIAGAGSGKTRVIVHRVAHLIQSGIAPSQIMMLTFTNKAAREMSERVQQCLGGHKPQESLIHGTFHSVASRFLRRHAKLLQYENHFTILDTSDSKDLIKAAIGEVVGKTDKHFPNAGVLQSIFSLAFNKFGNRTALTQKAYLERDFNIQQIIAEDYPHLEDHLEVILQIHRMFRQKKRRNQAMGFDDLLENWLELLIHHAHKLPWLPHIRHILVDEYQDTNHIQADLLKLLSAQGAHVMAVGDDAQSIYSWRGANFKNIMKFPEDFGAQIFRLEQNYRSTPEILELANASISQNTEQFEKTLYANRPNLEKPILNQVYDQREESEWILEKIQELRDQDLPLSQMSVLYRNHVQAAGLQVALTEAGIPFVIHSGVKFFEQAHIKDVVSFLKVLFNPLDEVAWMRILKMVPGIGNAKAQKIFGVFVEQQAVRLNSDNEALQQLIPKRAQEQWQKVLGCFQQILQQELKASDAIGVIGQEFYDEYLYANYEQPAQRKADLRYLQEFSDKYDSIEKFLNDVALVGAAVVKEYEEEEYEEDCLTLTTIHQAKGLEWEAVFLIGLTEGQFPHQRCLTPYERLEEERRLFYVAITRAQKHLLLTAPVISNHFGNIQSASRSRFVEELPQELIEVIKSETNATPSYHSYYGAYSRMSF